jgi:hypothetical protein
MTPTDYKHKDQYLASMVEFYDNAIRGCEQAIVDYTMTRRKWVDALEALKAAGEMPRAFQAGFEAWRKKRTEVDF